MTDTIYQAVGQAFIKSATVMGNIVHNVVVKAFAEGMFPGCVGPSLIQPNQMNFVPLEAAVVATLSATDSRPETSNNQTSMQTTAVTSPHLQNPVYSTPPPVPTAVQGGSVSGFPKGWNPATGLGMPPEFFTPISTAQSNALATQPIASQQNASAAQPTAQNSWNP